MHREILDNFKERLDKHDVLVKKVQDILDRMESVCKKKRTK